METTTEQKEREASERKLTESVNLAREVSFTMRGRNVLYFRTMRPFQSGRRTSFTNRGREDPLIHLYTKFFVFPLYVCILS